MGPCDTLIIIVYSGAMLIMPVTLRAGAGVINGSALLSSAGVYWRRYSFAVRRRTYAWVVAAAGPGRRTHIEGEATKRGDRDRTLSPDLQAYSFTVVAVDAHILWNDML